MIYELMHRDVSVAAVEIDDNGLISKVPTVLEPEHMPFGTVAHGIVTDEIKRWWKGRSIPANRDGLERLEDAIGTPFVTSLLVKSLDLSLSDAYWIRPPGSGVSWKDVNYFDNPFSEDIGNILFGDRGGSSLDCSSPDITSDGVMMKRWKISEGRRCLLKSGTAPMFQEPINEAIASMFMEASDVPHAAYRLSKDDRGRPLSVCECFTDADSELVSASRVMLSSKRPNDRSLYAHT